MSELVIDEEILLATADIISGYCDKQKGILNDYYDRIMALEYEWRDDETFGGIAREIIRIKNDAIAMIDEVNWNYPNYFREKAHAISNRPQMQPSGTVRRVVDGVKTAVSVAATAAAAVSIPLAVEPTNHQYVENISGTEIVRTVDSFERNLPGDSRQEKINQSYSEMKDKQDQENKKATGATGTGLTISGGADIPPQNDAGFTIIEDENGMPIEVVLHPESAPNTLGVKKYTDGVVVEGELTFSNGDGGESTVAIKRKVHQYADGIDLNYKRADGKTNLEAMIAGGSPVVLVQAPDGVKETRLDLHHLTQEESVSIPGSQFLQGTLVEMPVASHQKYTKTIHMRYPRENGIRRSFRVEKTTEHKWVRSKDDRQFEAFKGQYWKTRALMLQKTL